MTNASWSDLLLASASDEDGTWELFHENSKVQRHGHHVSNEQVARQMLRMATSLRYDGHPLVRLPRDIGNLAMPLNEAIVNRVTPKQLEPVQLSLKTLGAILFAGCGLTRSNETTGFLRPFRTAPSGGGLFPLELYVSTKHVAGLGAGLYHFDPNEHGLRCLRIGDYSHDLSESLVEFQAHLAFDSAAIVLMTAIFQRSTFKYGARGYRFVLIEVGHVAQNMNLAATALGLGCFNLGGFYDRAADRFLGIDGLHQSTVYMMALGERAAVYETPQWPSDGR